MQGDDGGVVTGRDLDAALREKPSRVPTRQRQLRQALQRDQGEDGER